MLILNVVSVCGLVFATAIVTIYGSDLTRQPATPTKCNVTDDCAADECCVQSLANITKICRRIGKKAGDACGGTFFCEICGPGLECLPSVDQSYESTFFGVFGSCIVAKQPVVPLGCRSSDDCPEDECCVQSVAKNTQTCREVGKKAGDSCGGSLYCEYCAPGLNCLRSVNETSGLSGTCIVAEKESFSNFFTSENETERNLVPGNESLT